MKYLIFIILLVSACERDMGEMGAADAAPQPIDANTTAEEQWQIWRGFSEELNAYSTEQGLGGDWYWWVKIRASSLSGEDPRTNRFFFPYTRARMPGGKTVQVLVQYQPGREGFYSPPFEGGETEHLQLLEELLNLWYKGWTFNLHPTGEISSEEADLVAVLGLPSDGTSYFDGTKTVHLVYETAIVHESLHWLWFWHHYCGAPWDDQSQCTEHPPEEGACVMDRQNGMGNVERFTLQIPEYSEEERARMSAITSELLRHYPPHKAADETSCGNEMGNNPIFRFVYKMSLQLVHLVIRPQ